MKSIHARIEGRVQGVFFRDFTRKEALKLGLEGWVKNMEDGAVEAVFSGEENKIKMIIDWLYTGSPHSNVTKVIVNDFQDQHTFSGFRILL